MKIYLAGPMRGYKAYNFPNFEKAARLLREQKHIVFSPAERDRKAHPGIDWDNLSGDLAQDFPVGSPFSMREAIMADLDYIGWEAEAVAVLPGWEKSTGVAVENALCNFLGLTLIVLGREYTV